MPRERIKDLLVGRLVVQNSLNLMGAEVFPITWGDSWHVDPANGNDNNSGEVKDEAFATVAQAAESATDNNHDRIFFYGYNTADDLDEAFDWDLNHTHLIGVNSGISLGARSRITQAAGTEDISPLFTVSGNGNSFHNIQWFNGIDDDGSLINVSVTGQRNEFFRCFFAGIGHDTQGAEADARALVLNGGDENWFEECVIGIDTIGRAEASSELEVTGNATRNWFIDCEFRAWSTAATHTFILCDTLDRSLILIRPRFMNVPAGFITGSLDMDSAFNIAAGINGYVYLEDPRYLGVTAKCASGSAARVFESGVTTSDGYTDYSDYIGFAVNPTTA